VHPEDLGLVLEILAYEMHADTSLRAKLPSRSTRLLRVLDHSGESHWMEAYLSNFLTEPDIGMILVDLQVPSQFRHTDDALAASQSGAPINEVLGLLLQRLTDGQPGQSAATILDRQGVELVSSPNVSDIVGAAGTVTWDLALTPDVNSAVNGTLRVWSPYTPAHPIDIENAEKVARYAALVIAQRATLGALEEAALHDPLTGVANRRALESRLDQRYQSGNSTLLAYLDLDGFKSINDTLGHAAGDQVLAIVADRLRSALRPEDVVARVGGDEFVLLLASATPVEALRARLDTLLREPMRVGDHKVTISASIGFSTGVGDPDALLHDADTDMLARKPVRVR
jgi:diguanylate cyclase (GGDEF)-like protein